MDIVNVHKLPTLNRGFSLVELMVALVVTLILLAGIGQIFLSSKKSFVIQDSLGRMQENGRYAMETIEQDVRRAGYWGGNADVGEVNDYTPGGISNGNKVATDDGKCSDANWARMLSHRIFGKNDNRQDYTCLPADSAPKGDILVLRYSAPWEIGGITTGPTYMADHPNQFFMRSSLFDGQLFQGKDETAIPIITAPVIRTAELVSHGYFIHNSESGDANKCTGSDAVPSLYRMTLTDGALLSEEVAYGVDNFQVQYGVDDEDICGSGKSDDNSVDCFVDAKAANDPMWGKVIAARVWLLTRAECPETGYTNDTTYTMAGVPYTPPANDHYRRQLYTSTIRLRNR